MNEFNLPKHGLGEELPDDDMGEFVRANTFDDSPIIHSKDDLIDSACATQEGLAFSSKLISFLNLSERMDKHGNILKVFSAPETAWVHNLIRLYGEKFDFTGRKYLIPIYNGDQKMILLQTARQVEKCVLNSTEFLMHNGDAKKLTHLRVGDLVVSYDDSGKAVTDKILGIESNGIKELYRITTKKKRSTVVTSNHPFKQLLKWTDAKDLKIGDFVGLPHTAGQFGDTHCPDEAYLIGMLIGDGSMGKDNFSFTQREGPLADDFLRITKAFGETITAKNRAGTTDYSMSKIGVVRRIAEKWEIWDKRSVEKSLAPLCFNLDKISTASLLRGLWGTDGHCKNVTKSKIDLCYSSISKGLTYGIQRLLLKFGIFSSIRVNKPTLYKGTSKVAYILRITGRKSFERFHLEIGPIPGKPFTLSKGAHNCNSHKIPKEINSIIESALPPKSRYETETLYKHGLRRTLGYNPTFEKVESLLNFLRAHAPQSTAQIRQIEDILDSDIFWDEVSSIEQLPAEETFAVETEKHHNYVTDGIITHNSTFLGNKIVVRSAVRPYFRTLYISPSHIQTRTFSNDRLKVAIESSPVISKYLQNAKVSQQVFEKGFTNGSFIFLRSAFLSADRARGISSDQVCIDELQDILISNVPVILQCLSHSKYQYQFFAGTPKTHENTITQYWKRTTQCEWMVPCSHCSAETGKKWNYLDKSNIGLHGPICKYCGKGLDVSVGEWQKAQQSDFYGYRISQLMVPWIVKKDSDAWKTMIMQMETYPESQFQNEVLGLPFDNAAKPITRAQLMQCCDSNHHFIRDPLNLTPADVEIVNNNNLIGGIDWGEGNDGSDKGLKGKFKTASYTVFTIGAYSGGDKFKIYFMKRFTGKEIDPEYIVNYVAAVYQRLGLKMIGVDWGFGWGVNNALFRKVGPQHCVQFMYVDRQKQTRKWDHIGYKFQLLRNHVISEVYYGLKKQEIVFPRFDEWASFATDILNVGVEYSEYQRKMMYVHRSSEPDDSLHSLLYCREAAKIFHGRYV